MPMSCELSMVFLNWFEIFVILRRDVFGFYGFYDDYTRFTNPDTWYRT